MPLTEPEEGPREPTHGNSRRTRGAVGITGDTSDNDELCALAGIAPVGLHADTGASVA